MIDDTAILWRSYLRGHLYVGSYNDTNFCTYIRRLAYKKVNDKIRNKKYFAANVSDASKILLFSNTFSMQKQH